MERLESDSVRPTVTIHRDHLLGLIDQSVSRQPRAHTVSRAELRSRAVTKNEVATAEMPVVAQVEPLDTDLSPQLSPHLVAAVIALLLVVFLAVLQAR